MQFTEFYVGQIFDAGPFRVDEAAIIDFARQFDPQVFHVDKRAAEIGRWKGLIASGWHTCAIAMRMVVDTILKDSNSCGSPGLEHLNWPAPVRPGDELRLQVEVLETKRSRKGQFGVVRWQWRMFNQNGQPVLDLIATSLFGEPD
jgi:acyl dehydratase